MPFDPNTLLANLPAESDETDWPEAYRLRKQVSLERLREIWRLRKIIEAMSAEVRDAN